MPEPPASLYQLTNVFSNVVRVALTGAGIACLIMLVWGGIQYLSAGSDKEGAVKAQKTLTYAIGGLVLSLSAWIILNLLGNFLGVDFSVFKLCLDATCK